ncbi:MAG TPA: TIM-barrel domain-containing protein [Clostridiaceae bacterium]
MVNWGEKVKKLLDIEQASYHTFKCLKSVSSKNNNIILDIETSENRKIHGILSIYKDGMFRLRFSTEPIKDTPSILIVANNYESPPYILEEGESIVKISTSELTIIFNKDPFDFKVTNSKGEVLLYEKRDDTMTFMDVGPDFHGERNHARISYPLGFVEADEGIRFTEAFAIEPDEAFYGFGEKFTPINKLRQVLHCYNDWSIAATEGQNKSVPFFMSSKGYGLFFNSLSPQIFDIGVKSSSVYSYAIASNIMDMYFINGPSYKDIISEYTRLTGRPELPPKWSFGIWMSRCSYWDRSEVEDVADRMREEQFPCDVLRIDPSWFEYPVDDSIVMFDQKWSEKRFPKHLDMIKNLKNKGFKLCLWYNSRFSKESGTYKEGNEKGYFAADPENSMNCGYVDLTNKEAFLWLKDKVKELVSEGASTFFLDVGMDVPTNLQFKNIDSKDIRNAYSFLYNQVVYEAIKEQTGENGVVWGLSGYAGSQRFAATAGGDARSSFQDMASVLRGGLSAAMSGFSYWGCDIGGFGIYPGPTPDPVLYIRYIEHGFFLPYSNVHGTGPREPWGYGDIIKDIYKKYAQLRYKLIPYIYTEAYLSSETGIPMMRPLLLEYQNDLNTRNIDLQYLFGDCFLVAPVFGGEKNVDVYLPEGIWYDYWTKTQYKGLGWIKYLAPLDILPLFVKEGSIIPMAPLAQNVDSIDSTELTLDIYMQKADFSGRYYDDKKDQLNNIHLIHKDKVVELYLEDTQLKYNIIINNIELPSRIYSTKSSLKQCLSLEEYEDSKNAWVYDENKLLIKVCKLDSNVLVIK